MAFKNVNEGQAGKFKKLTELEIGAALTGYYLGFKPSTTIEGALSLIMLIDGEKFLVSAAGNVKYNVMDGKLALGRNTKITRNEDVKVKGKKSTNFTVEQDADDTIPVEAAPMTAAPQKATPSSSPSVAAKIAAMKAGSANGTTQA